MNRRFSLLSVLLAATALFLLLDSSAWAQGGGRGGGWRNRGVDWEEDFGQAKEKAKGKGRFIFLYFHDPEVEEPSTGFNGEDLRKASRETWIFVKKPFERNDPLCTEFKIRRAPMLIGMDEYANEFERAGRASSSGIRTLMKTVETRVALYCKILEAEYNKGLQFLRQKKNSKALDSFCRILEKMNKPGYPEVKKADDRIVEYALKEIERIGAFPELSAQLKAGKSLAGNCRGSSVEGRIHIGMALMEHDAGRIAAALKRLADATKKLSPKQADEVRDERESLVALGLRKIEALLVLCDIGEKEDAREGLKMVKEDYKGTEVSGRAAEALKSIR